MKNRTPIGLIVIAIVALMAGLLTAGPAQASVPSAPTVPSGLDLNDSRQITANTTANQPATLQRLELGGWKDVFTRTANSSGEVTFPTPAGFYQNTYVRVRNADGFGNSAVYKVEGPQARNSNRSIHGKLYNTDYRLNRDRTYGYRIRKPDLSTKASFVDDAIGGMDRLSDATGVNFVYKGLTTTRFNQSSTTWESDTDFLIDFANNTQSNDYCGTTTPPGGCAQPAAVASAQDETGATVFEILKGKILINAAAFEPNQGGYCFNYSSCIGETILHEAGHAAGLAHVQTIPDSNGDGYEEIDPNSNANQAQIMSYYNVAPDWWMLGDLQGLQERGFLAGPLYLKGTVSAPSGSAASDGQTQADTSKGILTSEAPDRVKEMVVTRKPMP